MPDGFPFTTRGFGDTVQLHQALHEWGTSFSLLADPTLAEPFGILNVGVLLEIIES